MKPRGLIRHTLSFLWIACAALTLLVTACQPIASIPTVPVDQPTAPEPPAQPSTATPPPADEPGGIRLDLTGVADDMMVVTVGAVQAGDDQPWWMVAPEHGQVSLQGYPVSEHSMKPRIVIYPAAELAEASEESGQALIDLQDLLQTRQPVEEMPFLPLTNATQVLHAQVRYLDFKTGSGVRYLVQHNQGIVLINNYDLFYTYQGLTSDGKYYIAAILPVTHPDLPATSEVGMMDKTERVSWLDQQPSSSFTPDLAALDVMIQSLEVR